MKTFEVKMLFIMIIFAGIAITLKWCTAEFGILVVIMQLLVSIVTILSRIYNIISHSADLRNGKSKRNDETNK